MVSIIANIDNLFNINYLFARSEVVTNIAILH